jgi:glucosylceramidase
MIKFSLAVPWSAPSWLKVNGTLVAYSESNTLVDDDQVYSTYASYLKKSVDAFEAKGLRIQYLALQNEPLFGTSDQYPGMYLSAQNAAKLARVVRPLFRDSKTKLLAYDHNWDHPEYVESVLNSAKDNFDGVAWHCYGGDMASAQDRIQSFAPNLPQLLTECTGGYPDNKCDISKGMTNFGFNHEWDMKNILLGAAIHGATAGLKWIIALDENCGPTLPTVTFTNGRPLVSIPSTAQSIDDIKFNQDFWSIAHMSRFLTVDSVRVNTAVKVSGNVASSVLAAAFTDKVSAIHTAIIMNLDHSKSAHLQLTDGSSTVTSDYIPPFSTKIYQWKV